MEIREKSVIPIYGLAVYWVLYCLILPLYKPLHFILLIAIGAVVYALLSKLFPGKVTYVEVPEEPELSGNAEIDKLLEEGRGAASEMRRISRGVAESAVRKKLDKLAGLTEKIFEHLLEDPGDYESVRRFATFYLPPTMKLLYTYERLGRVDESVSGENITGMRRRIEDVLDMTITGFTKQYDGLYGAEALDIKTDITALKSFMMKEGIYDGE
ncbi:MAG TPA: hypothetical protein GXZ77_05815 [Papillibacter sp.]|nr:hypothetical protein [Papillibacter sp.]